MPWGDGTGPAGQGPMTGRKMGFCAGYDSPGYTKGVPMGRRWFGRGFGWRWSQQPVAQQPVQQTITREDEKRMLQEELNGLQKTVETIKKRLEELK